MPVEAGNKNIILCAFKIQIDKNMVIGYGLPVIAAVRVIRKERGWNAVCGRGQTVSAPGG